MCFLLSGAHHDNSGGDPQRSKYSILDLLQLLRSSDAVEFEIAMLSALIVFKDVCPGITIEPPWLVFPYLHTYIHAYIHTYIHTAHTYTYISTYIQCVKLFNSHIYVIHTYSKYIHNLSS